MRKILTSLAVLALSILFFIEWTESVTSTENNNQAPSEAKNGSVKPPETKPAESKTAGQIPVDPPATTKTETPPVKKAETTRPEPFDPLVDEILRLRAENGSALRGSLLEKINRSTEAHVSDDADSTKDSFTESLQRVAKETPVAPRSFVDRPLSEDPPPLLGPSGESQPIDAEEAAETAASHAAYAVAQLRVTSRVLDHQANDLEERRRYDDAKRLRKLSDQIRAEARRIDAEAN